jgi:pimeloyl-ACP methyl ester carboxylesterase
LLITSNEGLAYESALLMKERIEKAKIWSPEGISHLINIEEPDLFNKRLLEFLLETK